MSQPLRLLLVEDSEQDAELVLCELRRGGYDVTYERVQTGDAMRHALVHNHWDIVLSDYSMPGFSGTGALEVLNSVGQDLPFIVISPYSKTNYVDSTVIDQSSVVRFIEDNWTLPRIGNGSFDEFAGSIENMFNFKNPPGENLILDPYTGAVLSSSN